MTQPSLTRAIQKLEEEFGGLLFRRERALTHLTELGRLMLPHLERSYLAAQQARAMARQVERGQVSPLSLGLAPDVHLDGLPLLFHDLAAAFPGFSLTLTVREGEALVADAMAGELDAAIGAFAGELPERVDRWELREERLGWLHLGDVAGAEGLASCPRIAVGPAGPDEEGAETPVHRAGTLAAAAFLVAGGLGVAIVPEGLPRPPGTRWSPIAEGGERHCGRRRIDFFAVAGRRRTAAVDAFLKSVRARGWDLAATG